MPKPPPKWNWLRDPLPGTVGLSAWFRRKDRPIAVVQGYLSVAFAVASFAVTVYAIVIVLSLPRWFGGRIPWGISWAVVTPLIGTVGFGLSAYLSFRKVRRLESRPGLCRNCGYDLRATPDRCPECGGVAAVRGDDT